MTKLFCALSLLLLSCGVAEAETRDTDCFRKGSDGTVYDICRMPNMNKILSESTSCEIKMKEAMRLAEKYKEALWSLWAPRVETSPESYSSYGGGYTHIRCITVECLQKELDAAKRAEKYAADLKQAKIRWDAIYQECVK